MLTALSVERSERNSSQKFLGRIRFAMWEEAVDRQMHLTTRKRCVGSLSAGEEAEGPGRSACKS